jgi:hypothetical protein
MYNMADTQKSTDASSEAVNIVTERDMTQSAKYFYDLFCAARAESRQTEEGQALVAEFVSLGKEQGDKMAKIMEEVAQGALTG